MRYGPPLVTVLPLLLLLGGVRFAPGGDKPASHDLGKIQPPGGVPLPLGRPGTEITVDYLNKAKARLAAVPAEDLEKWVVELERIMGKKLEGELARQACRTFFVTRMSAAFEGLEWNARAADNLFKRAQTMPASEAEVWKKGFEALLRKEIGQTDATNLAGGRRTPSRSSSSALTPFMRVRSTAPRVARSTWRA